MRATFSRNRQLTKSGDYTHDAPGKVPGRVLSVIAIFQQLRPKQCVCPNRDVDLIRWVMVSSGRRLLVPNSQIEC
jgi:hypothetical protein